MFILDVHFCKRLLVVHHQRDVVLVDIPHMVLVSQLFIDKWLFMIYC